MLVPCRESWFAWKTDWFLLSPLEPPTAYLFMCCRHLSCFHRKERVEEKDNQNSRKPNFSKPNNHRITWTCKTATHLENQQRGEFFSDVNILISWVCWERRTTCFGENLDFFSLLQVETDTSDPCRRYVLKQGRRVTSSVNLLDRLDAFLQELLETLVIKMAAWTKYNITELHLPGIKTLNISVDFIFKGPLEQNVPFVCFWIV